MEFFWAVIGFLLLGNSLLYFFFQIFWSFPQCFPDSPHLPTHPILCSSPSFSQKQTQEQKQKQKIPKSKIKTKKTKICPNKKLTEQKWPPPKKRKTCGIHIFCWSATPGDGAYLRVWLIYTVRMHWSERVSPSAAGINWRVSWLEVGLCIHFPLSVLETLSACCHSLRIHQLSRVCFLGVIHHFWLLQSFWLLFHIDPWAWGEGFDEHVPFTVKKHSVLFWMSRRPLLYF